MANKAKQQRGIRALLSPAFILRSVPASVAFEIRSKNKKKGVKRGILGGIEGGRKITRPARVKKNEIKSWRKQGWVIPPKQNGDFVAHMERVLEVYKRPYDARFPVVCMDESPKQLIKETHQMVAATPGHPARYDYEYERGGVCNIFLASEPLAGKRLVKITERKTKRDWALFVKEIAQRYKKVEKITLVMDNLSTHKPGSLYETFSPEEAKALWDRFEFVYTPKHGSWLNMAEIELNVLTGKCLNKRINIPVIRRETDSWQNHRNNLNAKINWQFTTSKARIKLKQLYPTYEM